MGNPRGKRSGYPLWKLALLIFCVLPTILLGSETGKSQQHDAKLLSDPEKMGQTEGEENFEGDDDESDKLETIKERGEKLADDNASDPINEPNKNRGRSAQRTANMVHTIRSCFNENALRRTGKRKVLPTFSYVTGNPLVELATVVDHVDINNLNVLASCIRFYLPENVEDRQFDEGPSGYGGGNNVTYIGTLITRIMPEFKQYVVDVASAAAERAGWRPHPSHLGIRCVEKLVYPTNGELLYHTDADSVYTLVIMLSHASQYTGGRFLIQRDENDKTELSFSPPYGGGVFFDSNMNHAVEPIKTGQRVALAIEFWPYEDVSVWDKRPPIEPYENHVKLPTLITVKPYTVKDVNAHSPVDTAYANVESSIPSHATHIFGLGPEGILGVVIGIVCGTVLPTLMTMALSYIFPTWTTKLANKLS